MSQAQRERFYAAGTYPERRDSLRRRITNAGNVYQLRRRSLVNLAPPRGQSPQAPVPASSIDTCAEERLALNFAQRRLEHKRESLRAAYRRPA
jgi:hypothetical protein